MDALEPPQPYDESRIDWNAFLGDPLAQERLHYEPPNLKALCRSVGLLEEDGRRRWRQLMYFFATLWVMDKAETLSLTFRPIQPPPRLEPLWRAFTLQRHDDLLYYCQTFFDGEDLGWRERYSRVHALTSDRLRNIRQIAERVIELPIDYQYWRFDGELRRL